MGLNDYNKGYENPYASVDHTKSGSFDFQQGQYAGQEALKSSGPSEGGRPPAPRVAADSDAPLCAPRKSQSIGVACCIFGGPLGLFYSSKKAALIMLAAVAAAFTQVPAADHATTAAPDSLAALLTTETLWPAAAAVSIVWSVVAVSAFNRRAAHKDAAALAEWLTTKRMA